MKTDFGRHVWAISADRFAAAWNGAASLDEAAEGLRQLAGGPAPRWSLLARAVELRKQGLDLKPHAPTPVKVTTRPTKV